MFRRHGTHGLNSGFLHAFSRRIDDDRIGLQSASSQFFCSFSRIGTDKLRVFDTVCRRIGFCVFNGLRDDLGANNMRKMTGKTQTDRSGTTVEIKSEVAAAGID